MTDYYYDESASGGANSGTLANPWETLSDMITGMGSASGGDTCTVRTADAGGDLSATISANTTIPGGSWGSPLTYIFDDGTVWPHAGQFTIATAATSSAIQIIVASYAIIKGDGENYRIRFQYNYTGTSVALTGGAYSGNEIDGLQFDLNSSTGTPNKFNLGESAKYTNIKITSIYSGNYPRVLFDMAQAGDVTIKDLVVDCTGMVDGSTRTIFNSPVYATSLRVDGLKVINGSAAIQIVDISGSGNSRTNDYEFINVDTDMGDTVFFDYTTQADDPRHVNLRMFGGANDYDFQSVIDYAIYDFVYNDSFPTLTSTLPDESNSGFSIRCRPFNTARHKCTSFPPIDKPYKSSAGIKDITLELLVVDSLTLTDFNTWIEVMYIDNTTGEYRRASSRVAEASEAELATSTADWSASTFGVDSYNKRKITLQTPTAVKNGRIIKVQGYTEVVATDTQSFFYEPDVTVEDV